jgi:hypothetical protein
VLLYQFKLDSVSKISKPFTIGEYKRRAVLIGLFAAVFMGLISLLL